MLAGTVGGPAPIPVSNASKNNTYQWGEIVSQPVGCAGLQHIDRITEVVLVELHQMEPDDLHEQVFFACMFQHLNPN
jgi:hypothetical protein